MSLRYRDCDARCDQLTDLHVWRLGPGHPVAVLSVATGHNRGAEDYYRGLLRIAGRSQITVEVHSL